MKKDFDKVSKINILDNINFKELKNLCLKQSRKNAIENYVEPMLMDFNLTPLEERTLCCDIEKLLEDHQDIVINKPLIKELQKQTPLLGTDKPLTAIAKIIHPLIDWKWYLICFKSLTEMNSIYCLCDGPGLEFGFVGLEEINSQKIQGIQFKLDKTFKEYDIEELFDSLTGSCIVL